MLGKQILHHLDLTIAVPEIARVLRPGGRAVFLEPLIHNPILEGYRRLTPHLRSPTEQALSMRQIAWMGSHFRGYTHREFILLSILPVLASVLTRTARRAGRLAAAPATPRPHPGPRRALAGPLLLGDGDRVGALVSRTKAVPRKRIPNQ